MKQMFKQVVLTVGLLSGVAVLALAPSSLAHDGVDHEEDDSRVATTAQESESENETEVHTLSGDDKGRGSLHSRAQSFLADKREGHKEHTMQQRQKTCEARQKGILKRTNAYANAAERHLGNFDKIFMNVQAFYIKKELSVSNYDDLVTTAAAKQSAAQLAVDALKELDVELDCTQDDPAATVANIKTAVADAKTALKEYRSAIKDLVAAVKTAVGDSAEGSDE